MAQLQPFVVAHKWQCSAAGATALLIVACLAFLPFNSETDFAPAPTATVATMPPPKAVIKTPLVSEAVPAPKTSAVPEVVVAPPRKPVTAPILPEAAPMPVAAREPAPGPKVVSEPPPTPPSAAEPVVKVVVAKPQPAVVAPTATIVTPKPAPRTAPPAPLTGLGLVQKANSHVPEQAKNRVLKLVSGRTALDAQPQRWRIVFYDPEASYNAVELRFENGQVARQYEPARLLEMLTPQSKRTIDLEKVKVDSDAALRRAIELPSVSELRVQGYELELERGSDVPVWRVRLFGRGTSPSDWKSMGNVTLRSDDGEIVKETFPKK